VALRKPRCPHDETMMDLVDPSNRHFGEKWACPKCGYAGDRSEIGEKKRKGGKR
jgi:hypothetical protein